MCCSLFFVRFPCCATVSLVNIYIHDHRYTSMHAVACTICDHLCIYVYIRCLLLLSLLSYDCCYWYQCTCHYKHHQSYIYIHTVYVAVCMLPVIHNTCISMSYASKGSHRNPLRRWLLRHLHLHLKMERTAMLHAGLKDGNPKMDGLYPPWN